MTFLAYLLTLMVGPLGGCALVLGAPLIVLVGAARKTGSPAMLRMALLLGGSAMGFAAGVGSGWLASVIFRWLHVDTSVWTFAVSNLVIVAYSSKGLGEPVHGWISFGVILGVAGAVIGCSHGMWPIGR